MKCLSLLSIMLLSFMGCSKKHDVKNNCCTDANLRIVSPNPNITIMPPNVITPNGDGYNEQLIAVGFDKSSSTPNAQIAFTSQQLIVYPQQSSTPVFSKTNYQGSFDGHDDGGAELPEGTYRYTLVLDDNTVTGNVCIVRRQSACNCRSIDLNDPLLPTTCQ